MKRRKRNCFKKLLQDCSLLSPVTSFLFPIPKWRKGSKEWSKALDSWIFKLCKNLNWCCDSKYGAAAPCLLEFQLANQHFTLRSLFSLLFSRENPLFGGFFQFFTSKSTLLTLLPSTFHLLSYFPKSISKIHKNLIKHPKNV